MIDYGEPWGWIHATQDEGLLSASGIGDTYYDDDGKIRERIISCVNALKGCPDPAKFMAAIRMVLPKFMYAAPGIGETRKLKESLDHPDLAWIREEMK